MTPSKQNVALLFFESQGFKPHVSREKKAAIRDFSEEVSTAAALSHKLHENPATLPAAYYTPSLCIPTSA